jgi:hypothetical protein
LVVDDDEAAPVDSSFRTRLDTPCGLTEMV